MARYTLVSGDELANIKYAPTPEQTQLYNALGKDASAGDNFFTKRAKSIDNAIGTTGAAVAGAVKDAWENSATVNLLQDNKNRMDDIAKKYGYNTYQDVWDARDKAEAAGDTATLNLIDNTINPELKAQANANAQAANEKAANYADYMQNNDVSKRINQDPGKFAGSAINTLSTATDVLGLTNGPISNAIQGGIEGIADELEQNGLQNFDWDRARQNALTGAASGAAVGVLNKGLSNSLAKKGGNLFKGGNKLTQGLNDLGSKTAAGRIGSTLATGAARGALSGAVGGATGAGLSSALNGVELGQGIANTFQGAVQGAGQGALAGTAMAGANMAISKTPRVGKFMQNVNQAQQDWQNSGDNLKNKLDNTLNSGKSVVGNELAIERLAKGIKRGTNGDIRFVDMTQDVFDDINNIRTQNGLEPITERQVIAFKNAVNNNLNNRVNEGLSARQVAKIAFNSLASEDARAIPGYYENQIAISKPGLKNDYDASVIGLAEDGRTSLKSIEPRTQNQIELFESQGQQKNGPKSQLGFSLAEEQPTSNSIVPQNDQNVNDLTQVFEPNGVKQIEKQNKFQFVGNRVKEAGDAQKYMALYNSLDKSTAEDVASRKIPQTLTALGVNPENYEAYAETSTYVNKVISDMADKSGIRVNAPDLAKKLSYDNIANDDITLSDAALKKYKQNVSRIVETGKDMNYGAGDLLRESRRMGQLAQNVSGNADDKVALRKLYNRDKWILRDLATSALDEAGLFGDQTDSNIATGLAQMGANQKVQDYYTAAIDGKSPSAADYIRRTAPFESAREMAIEMKSEPLTRSASKTSTNPLTMIYRSSGLEQPVNTFLSHTVAPVAGGLTKLAGSAIEGVGNLASKVNGAGAPLAPATATTTSNSYNPATQLYNAIGRTEGLTNAEQARTANYISDAVQGASSNTLESLVGEPTSSATSVYSSIYGTPTTATTASNSKSYFQPTGDYWTDILGTAMTSAIDNNDATAFGQLYEMYQSALSNNTSGAKTVSDLSSTQQAQLAKLDSADSAIDELETLFDRAGGGKGPIVGNLQSIAGDWGWDSNARTYNQLSEGLINQIALAIGKTDSLNTEGEVKRALQLIPQLTDDATTAKNKLEELRKMLATTKSSYNTAYGLTS